MIHSVTLRVASCALIAFSSALGADFYQNSTTARSAALGGVLLPNGESVSDALNTNPAALTRLSSGVLEGSLSTLVTGGSFTNSVTAHGSLNTEPGFLPTAALGLPLRSLPLTVAFGIAPEAVSRANWNYTDPPGGLGGHASYGSTAKTSELLAMRTTAGVGYRIDSHLSAGYTLGWVYDKNVFQAPYIFQTNPILAGLKTGLDLRTTGHGWNHSFGLLYRRTRRLEVGAAYQTATVIQSRGRAIGNAAQQFASLGVDFAPGFTYRALVETRLPRSLVVHADWRYSNKLRLALQVNRVQWASSFRTLPIVLTEGTNSDINHFTGATTLVDSVPLAWRNQTVVRLGLERSVGEASSVRAGYSHANNPVPSSTLTPLTASVFRHSVSAGYGYRFGKCLLDAAYTYYPRASESVGKSALLSGEFDRSQVSVFLHAVTVSAGYRF